MRRSLGQITDRRIKLLTNIIDGVHVVKLYGWDEGLLKLMLNIRK